MIAAAKQLGSDSECLQGVPDELRAIFLKLLAEADINAGNTSSTAQMHTCMFAYSVAARCASHSAS
jgi:hypothetical protein